MLSEVSTPRLSVQEGLVADGTAERLLSGVSPHVQLELEKKRVREWQKLQVESYGYQ